MRDNGTSLTNSSLDGSMTEDANQDGSILFWTVFIQVTTMSVVAFTSALTLLIPPHRFKMFAAVNVCILVESIVGAFHRNVGAEYLPLAARVFIWWLVPDYIKENMYSKVVITVLAWTCLEVTISCLLFSKMRWRLLRRIAELEGELPKRLLDGTIKLVSVSWCASMCSACSLLCLADTWLIHLRCHRHSSQDAQSGRLENPALPGPTC